MVRALRTLLAFASAFVAIYAVNLAGSVLAGLSGLAGGGGPRLAWDLLWVFLAGVAATWSLVTLAPVAPRIHAAVFFVLTLAVDGWAVVEMGRDWPAWFGAGILLTLPLQVWLGAWLALRRRRAVSARIRPPA